MLSASLIMQACLGGIYAWSIFALLLCENHGLSMFQTQVIFGCTVAAFTLTMVLAGKWQDQAGPRLVGLVGGLLFGTGYIVAAFSGGSFATLLVGLGLICGAGIGCGYVCPLATGIKWFPDHKGLITGISVAGFGGGAILLSSITDMLIGRGKDVLDVFLWLGVVYGVVVVICSLLLFVPDNGKKAASVAAGGEPRLFRREFFVMLIGMFSGTFAGLLVIGNLKSMGMAAGLPESSATVGIIAFAIGNIMGRIVWGHIYDRVGSYTPALSLFALSIAVGLLLALDDHLWLYIGVTGFVGFCFGACFVIYAAYVSTVYGALRLGSVYPKVFLLYGISALTGPPFGGWIYDVVGNYSVAVIMSAAIAFVGALGCISLVREEMLGEKNKQRRTPESSCNNLKQIQS